jgi:hypothetical protein
MSSMEHAQRRPVLFLIDVEPDARKVRTGEGGWEGTKAFLGHIRTLRGQLEDLMRTRVEFNWFVRLDPQIRETWGKADRVADECADLLKYIQDHGDFCGVHPHLWRWHPRRKEWFNDSNDAGWTAECLHTSIDSFRNLFGRPPQGCRFGDRWLNQPAVDLMQALGIRYDLTIEPGLPAEPFFDDPHATGTLPDYHRVPREPYQPVRGNFMAPAGRDADAGSLWIIPLTTTPLAWRLMPRRPYVMKASRSPNLVLRSAYVLHHLKTQLHAMSDAPLTMVVRTGDMATRRFLANYLRTIEELLAHPALPRCQFINPVNAIARWQASR